MLGALLCSLDAFLEDYLATPLKRIFPGKAGRAIAALVLCVCTVLFYRTHPALLLVASPLLLCAVLHAQKPKYLRHPRSAPARIPLALLCYCALALFALALLLDDPLTLFPMIGNAFRASDPLALYHSLISFTYLNHLLVLLAFLVLWAPLSHYVPRLVAKMPLRAQHTAYCANALFALLAFFLALLMILPQFPQFSTLVYGTRPL